MSLLGMTSSAYTEKLTLTSSPAGGVNDMKRLLVAVTALVLILSGLAVAGNNPDVKVGIHVLPHDPERGCYRNFPVVDDAGDIVFTYDGCEEVDFFPIFFDLTEWRCVQYAVVWPGSQICDFTVCSYSHIGEIIHSGDWIVHCWHDCKTGNAVIPGWGEVTMDAYGLVCLAPGDDIGEIAILDCDYGLDYPTANFCAGVCGRVGENPLYADQATVPSTWGKVKSLFR
jgi:hypothetical protein